MPLIVALALVVASQAAPLGSPQPSPRLQARSHPSPILGGERRVWVYAPPAGADAQPSAGLLICLWGQDYVGPIAAPETLDALIREGRIPPITALFLDQREDRFQSFETTRRVSQSIAEELIPWAKQTLGVRADAAHTIVAGYSAAGQAATYAAFAHPAAFGNVLSQSGAFWRGFEDGGATAYEWVAAQFAATPRRDIRLYLEVGGAETRLAGGSPVSIKTANEHLRDVLIRQGYDLTYIEVPDAQHEYGHWKAAFGPGLLELTKAWRAR
jgi:enterochelin esterase family protein